MPFVIYFEDGGAGGLGNFRVVNTFDGTYFGSGGYGGGGGGFTSQNFGCGGGGGGYSGGGGGGEVIYSDSFEAPAAVAARSLTRIRHSDSRRGFGHRRSWTTHPLLRSLFNGNGEIFITAVPEPASASLLAISQPAPAPPGESGGAMPNRPCSET